MLDLARLREELASRRWARLRGPLSQAGVDEVVASLSSEPSFSGLRPLRCDLRGVEHERGLLWQLAALLDPRRTVEDDERSLIAQLVGVLATGGPLLLVLDGADAVEPEAILIAAEMVSACKRLSVLIVKGAEPVIRRSLTAEAPSPGLPCRDVRTELAVRREGAFQRLYTIKTYRLDRGVGRRCRQQSLARLRATSVLRHPGVLSVYEVGWDGRSLFTVSEYAEGVSVRALLDRVPRGSARIPTQLALRMAACVARALSASHELSAMDGTSARLTHGDLSARSVLLAYDGTVRTRDFAIARELRRICEGPPAETDAARDVVADVQDLGRLLHALLERTPASPEGGPSSLAADLRAWPLRRSMSAARLAAERLESAAVRIEVREGIAYASDFVNELFDDVRSRQSAALQRRLGAIARDGGPSVRFALVPPPRRRGPSRP